VRALPWLLLTLVAPLPAGAEDAPWAAGELRADGTPVAITALAGAYLLVVEGVYTERVSQGRTADAAHHDLQLGCFYGGGFRFNGLAPWDGRLHETPEGWLLAQEEQPSCEPVPGLPNTYQSVAVCARPSCPAVLHIASDDPGDTAGGLAYRLVGAPPS
jgi:hypothetical protein